MKGMIWPDEVPSEVAAQRDGKAPEQAAAPGPRPRSAREPRKKLGAIRSAPTEPAGSDDAPEEPASAPADEPVEKTAELAGAPRHVPAAPDVKRESGKSGKRELPPYLRVVK
jgi:hypothetical protein